MKNPGSDYGCRDFLRLCQRLSRSDFQALAQARVRSLEWRPAACYAYALPARLSRRAAWVAGLMAVPPERRREDAGAAICGSLAMTHGDDKSSAARQQRRKSECITSQGGERGTMRDVYCFGVCLHAEKQKWRDAPPEPRYTQA